MLGTYRLAAFFAAAALMRATCSNENPPALVWQSWLGFALQNGQVSEMGLTGRTSGM